MAAEKVTPIDGYSGLPLAIAPYDLEASRPDFEVTDDHHGWHPWTAPLLRTIAGQALRNSWIQRVNVLVHNQGPYAYHRHYKGPELPGDEADIYGRVVLACAGYVPDEVIDMHSRDEPYVRPAHEAERAYLRQGRLGDAFSYRHIRYGYDPIRAFMAEYALKQDLSHIHDATIDEFLSTKDGERKRKIGDFLLWAASEVATDGIRDKYRILASENRLHPRMPKDPKPLVKWKLGSVERVQQEVLPLLELTLASQ